MAEKVAGSISATGSTLRQVETTDNHGSSNQRAWAVVFASTKGGCAKTTTALGLIGAAHDEGLTVEAIDTDVSQKTLHEWIGGRDDIRVTVMRPEAAADHIRASQAEIILIDTQGSDAPAVGHVLSVADLVVITMSDSKVEIDPAIRLFLRLRERGRRVRIVMSCVDRIDSARVDRARSRVNSAARLWTTIPRRVAVKDAAASHCLLSELAEARPVHDRFVDLLKEILEIRDKTRRQEV